MGVFCFGLIIIGGLFIGLERVIAVWFFFLLGFLVIILVGLVELKIFLDEGFGGVGLVLIIIGVFFVIIFFYFVIVWLIKYL